MAATNRSCPHSASCFTCPLADCKMVNPQLYNRLPGDTAMSHSLNAYELRGKKSKRELIKEEY